jgi:hypothetical protein
MIDALIVVLTGLTLGILYGVYRFGVFAGHRTGYIDGYLAAVKDFRVKSKENGNG